MGRWTLIAIAVVAIGCERASSTGKDQPGAGSAPTVTVPPPLPGEPPLGADREAMLVKFAANISQGIYTHSNLMFLLCNSEAGLAVANRSGDPLSKALMRRMVALFRAAPAMATATCPATPPRTP